MPIIGTNCMGDNVYGLISNKQQQSTAKLVNKQINNFFISGLPV
jgi:hypothetical protein